MLCGLAATLAPRLPSTAALVASLPVVERHLLPVTLLTSLSRLRHPAPTVLRHAASLAPRTVFAASWWPEPHVEWLRPRTRARLPSPAAWPGVPLGALTVAGRGDADVSWFADAAAPALGIAGIEQAEVPPLTDAFWGSGRAVEAVAAPTDLEALLGRLPDDRPTGDPRCRWCGQEVAASACPFCGLDRDAPGAPEAGDPGGRLAAAGRGGR